jgi:DNA-directed RNA polymerase specialized sigma24 family protein
MERLEADPSDRDHVLGVLMERYSSRLDAFLRKMNVRCPARRDELKQELWCRICRQCGRPGGWKPGRGADPLWSLMKTAAKRLVIDLVRRGHARAERWRTFCENYATFGDDVATCMKTKRGRDGAVAPRGPRMEFVGEMTRRERARLAKAVLAELMSLKPSDRRLLELVAEGKTTREIAITINRSPGQVCKVLTAARREVITRACDEDAAPAGFLGGNTGSQPVA